MKIAVVSLNLSGGQAIKGFFDTKTIKSMPLKTKYFYDYFKISKGSFEENMSGLCQYVDSIYDSFDAFIEFPVSFAYEHLYNKNQDTKFIYIKRTKESWIEQMKSLRNTVDGSNNYVFEDFFCNHYIKTEKNSIGLLDDEELAQIYDEHDRLLVDFFKDKENFLQIDFNDDLIFVKILSFLEFEKNSLE